MVQDVNQARTDLELLRFASPEVLAGRKIDVVDRSHVVDLSPTDGTSTEAAPFFVLL